MASNGNEADSSVNGSDFELVDNGNGFGDEDLVPLRDGGDTDRDSSPDSTTNFKADSSDSWTSGPRPVQILTVDNEGHFELDEEALNSVLLQEKCRDKPVVVVSIAGDFRKGKSFMLNFFLRYLSQITHDGGISDWLGDENESLKGFSWRGGAQRETTGILMWSEPFVLKNPKTREEVAIILMDTQGAFDSEFTVRDSAVVFALSTMTSSVQVFNLMHNLQEDNLQILEIFTEYGRLALEDAENDLKPFQKLVFLIRDWSYPADYPYGLSGGQKFLEKKLAVTDRQKAELQRVRRHIKSCFSDIECFLMPHPGLNVATNPAFDGRISEMEKAFVQKLREFVPLLLSPEHVVTKEIGGEKVTGQQLVEYFKVYIQVFKGEQMPEPKSMLAATAEANNLVAVASAKRHYNDRMEELCGGNMPYINPKILEAKSAEIIEEAVALFNKTRKMGGKEYSEMYMQRLHQELDDAFEHFKAQNDSKNLFNIWGSPLVLLVAWFIGFMMSRIFELIGITPLSNLFYMQSLLAFFTIVAYLSAKYTGNFPEFIQFIDWASERIWTFVMDKGIQIIQEKAQQQASQAVFGRQHTSPTPSGSQSRFGTTPSSSGGSRTVKPRVNR